MGNVIGIDLGTTNSVVAFLELNKPQVLPNSEGGKTTPSVVLYRSDEEIVVGELAKRQRLLLPERTIYSVKRFVGCRWDESESRRRGIAYPLCEGPNGMVAIEIDGRRLLPEEVQARTLLKMKQTAEDYLGTTVTQAVITCPAYFNDSQRQATKRAAELAGLEALRIVNEPTAAALAYGLSKRHNERIAVFDFGGGTFDISILEIDEDVIEVKSTCGDTFLGGDAIDQRLTEFILEHIERDLGLDVGGDPQVMARVAEAAEKVKCELSSMPSTIISLPFLGADAGGAKHLNLPLERKQYEEMVAPILERLREPCRQAMADARLSGKDLSSVVLVGGSTRIPAVRRLVEEIFGRAPDHSINPDEAVALGAAIQAGIMSGEIDEILLLDVTPLSLGIELAGGLFSPLIQRNSSIPTTARKKFTTVRDNQQAVTVHVLQGERRIALENRTLARFRLEGISPAPREVPEIEVSFNIDANGILNVAAMDLTTGQLQQVKVESYQPVLDADAQRRIDDAEQNADEDRSFVRKAAIRRRMEEMRMDMEALQRQSDTRPLTEREERRFTERMFRLDVALQNSDWGVIDSAERELKSVFSEIMMLVGRSAGLELDDLIFEADERREKENAAGRAPGEEFKPNGAADAAASPASLDTPGA